jgi:hypothetical protein
MSVTATNLLMGAGTLYYGTFGATEPADSAINTTPQASAWTDMGATDGGLKFSIDQKFSTLDCDQLVDDVGSRLTKRTVMFATNLAEPTLDNLKIAVNGGTSASGTGYATLDPVNTSLATQVPYFAALLDGFAPGPVNSNFARRVLIRKAVNDSKVEMAYNKDKQTYIPVQFKSHYVASNITPFRWIDQTA